MNKAQKNILIGLTIFTVVALAWVNRKKLKSAIDSATTSVAKFLLKPEQEVFIRNLNPAVQNTFREFIRDVENLGYAVLITDGYRDFADQLKQWIAGMSSSQKAEYAKSGKITGKSKNAEPGKSAHNYGLALDINLLKGTQTWRKADSDAHWESTGVPQLAKTKYGMIWGGDYNSYQDPIHFDLSSKYNTTDLLNKGIAQFGSREAIIGNQIKLAA